MLDHLRSLLHARPFAPFRVTLSSGERFEVRHPEFAWLLKGGLYVGLPNTAAVDGVDLPERAAFCSLLHITSAEPLDLEAASQGR